jgi:hypothetical protein
VLWHLAVVVVAFVIDQLLVTVFPLGTIANLPDESNGFQLFSTSLRQLTRLSLFPSLVLTTLVGTPIT